jgi:hypothetical protein
VFSEKFGRKKPLLFGTVLVIIGAILQAAAYGQPQFIVGRIVGGLGTGLNTSIIPVWYVQWRGKGSSICDLANICLENQASGDSPCEKSRAIRLVPILARVFWC